MVREWVHCCGEAANHQLPIAAAFWIIQIVSTEECSSLLQNLMQSCCSTHSVILNATATQYTCSLNGVYHTHWLVKSSLFMHVHSSPFSLAARLHQCCTNHSRYVNNGWTFSRQTSYIAAFEWLGKDIESVMDIKRGWRSGSVSSFSCHNKCTRDLNTRVFKWRMT